jgi:sirohydrochlorin cobaltochelatase
MEVVSKAVQQGIKRIRVLPLFLTAEGHVTRDIHPLVEEARESYADVVLELLPPVGQHPMFLELLKTIAIREP